MDYQKDINEEAVGFILEYEEDFQQAIVDGLEFDRNDINSLDENFHCDIVDRGYSLTDAAFVIENCENEETDSGLWDGQDANTAISTIAAFSFGNDVWEKCEEIYNGLVERFNEIKEKIKEAYEEDAEDDEIEEDDLVYNEKEIVEEIFKQLRIEHEIAPVEDVDEQIRLIERWLELNENAGLWGGYPVGSSYIDSRCGTGYGMPEIKDYVDFDRELAQKIPAIARKRKEDVILFLEELKQEPEKIFTLVNSNDANETHNLKAQDIQSAMSEALDVLGWQITEKEISNVE